MLLLVIRKMLNNRWMVSCLLIGCILAVAMISSIPMYTDGVLQKTLMGEMANYQKSFYTYPGSLDIKADLRYAAVDSNRNQIYQTLNNKISKDSDRQPKACRLLGGQARQAC